MRTVKVTEGHTLLTVPRASMEGPVPPTTPVFFNPAASTNRDVSVAIVEVTGGGTFCDAMAGIGPRGVRVANEVTRDVRVTMVDINPASLRLAKRNAKANGVEEGCEFVRRDAGAYLTALGGEGDRFDCVDVDPFGTPAPYLQPLLNSVVDGGVASVTATDTAVLCGVHPQVSKRRYGATPLNNEFHHETGIRILLNACRRQGAIVDLGVSPVAAHSTRHYIRVYFRVQVGASKADSAARNEGYVIVCGICGERERSTEPKKTCSACGGKARSAGPLWTGPLSEKKTVRVAADFARKNEFREAEKALTGQVEAEEMPPWSFSLEKICSGLRIPTVAFSEVAGFLEGMGFESSRQPYETMGVKTDAGHADVLRAVKEASKPVGKA